LAKRYLLKTVEGQVLENPEQMFMRVATALASIEKNYGWNGLFDFGREGSASNLLIR